MDRKPESVKVFIRVCPLQPQERSSVSHQQDSLHFQKYPNDPPKLFQFNKVFDPEATQLEIYQSVASPLVDQALRGYNATVLAYGQSGTGKTFTILGELKDSARRGIVPNVFSHILTQISLADTHTSYLLTVTFLEIYNEQVRDLLNLSSGSLEMRESPKLGVYVKNLSGITVECIDQVFEVIERGLRNRALANTNLNKESSRSHAIFTIRIENRDEDGTTSVGKLNLVDLAGSERVSKSLATGERLKEAVKINLSLSVLGNVISALVDNSSCHVPYRNSKLTRLLQDSLGGSCLTSMIATISGSQENVEETYYTLMYADRAKHIKNVVKKNVESRSVLKSFEEKIVELQEQLRKIDRKKDRRRQKTEKAELIEKINNLQKKILIGGENLLEKAQLQLQLLDYSAAQLKILTNTQQLLEQTLEHKKSETECFERKSLSLNEEDKLLDFQITRVEKKIAQAKRMLFNKESEYQNEIGNLLYANKCLAKDMTLAEYVIDKTISKTDLARIKTNMIWDEDVGEFRVKSVAHCGNNLKKISLNVDKKLVKVGTKTSYRKYFNEP